jgi:hypothetical protein
VYLIVLGLLYSQQTGEVTPVIQLASPIDEHSDTSFVFTTTLKTSVKEEKWVSLRLILTKGTWNWRTFCVIPPTFTNLSFYQPVEILTRNFNHLLRLSLKKKGRLKFSNSLTCSVVKKIYRGTDNSLPRPGRKQATATKV